MSSTRHRMDIRSMPLKSIPVDLNPTASILTPNPPIPTYYPRRDVRLIAIIFLPLVGLLLLANQVDQTYPWVLHFATWLFNLGS